MIKEGEIAPDFELRDQDGKMHSLDTIKGRYKVIYFYPKDNTPGCTLEAKMFDRDMGKYRQMGASIVGISGLDEASKKRFCEKHGLRLTLLADKDFSVSTSYGVYGEKSFMGRKYKGIGRTTFVLDGNNRIMKVFEKVNPLTHSKELLEYLKKASGPTS